jgi:5-methylcytosine-specific restriction protein A
LPVDLATESDWPEDWNQFEIDLKKTALVYDYKLDVELLPQIDRLVIPLVGIAMSLIGTEISDKFGGALEGASVQYLATRYERKKLNRDACLRLRGTICTGCGFDFGKIYGPIAEGFIEVHHVESLASNGEVFIDPAVDLVPLCSNCHSVVHRVAPPMPISELRELVKGRDKCSNA